MYRTERLDGSKERDLERAAELLRAGETVAFPTETVYGLGADALSPAAIARIFAAKQRPRWDPLIVHVVGERMLAQVATAGPLERELMSAFWPGPLTLLLPRSASIVDAVTAGRERVGVREPLHPVARSLIERAGLPIAAPSANRFGHTSPTTAQHVLDDLDGRIAAVVDGGETAVGVESTVAEVRSDSTQTASRFVRVYRPGAVSLSMLERVVGEGQAELYRELATASAPESLPSPGVGMRHYAPRARLLTVQTDAHRLGPLAETLVYAIDMAAADGSAVGVLLPDGWDASRASAIYPWGAWHDPEQLAHRLFAGLRSLDDQGATVIVCPVPQAGGLRDAIRDRLLKAARS